MIDCLIFSWPY